VTVGNAVVLVQAAMILLLEVRLVRRGEWGLLVLQRLLVVVEGERKIQVDHNIEGQNFDMIFTPFGVSGSLIYNYHGIY
jgi:predicted flavoprotein YhiN